MAKGNAAVATKTSQAGTKAAAASVKEKPVAKLGAGAAAALKETRVSVPSNGKASKKPSKPAKSTDEAEDDEEDIDDAAQFDEDDVDIEQDEDEEDGAEEEQDGDEEEEEEADDGESKEPVSLEQTEEQKKLVLDGMALLKSMDQHDATEVFFDLGNLAAFNSHTVDKHAYSQNPKQYLETIARDNVQLLINRLFSQPTQPTPPDINGRLVAIPPPSTQLPREKPLPKPKPPTKWEQFAKLKGIQQRKRGRMLWDEDKQQYLPRYGYNKANDDSSTWAIEAKGGEDTSVDPWTRLANEKKERIAKNKKQQEKNVKAAEGNRLPGTLDLTAVMPEKGVKRNQIGKEKKQRHVDIALEQAQRSTASMGKFDDVRNNEPSRKTEKAPKRDAEFARDIKAERAHNLAILNKVVHNDESENFNVTRAVNANQQQKESRKRARKERGGDDDGPEDSERPRGRISKGKMNRAKSQGRKEEKGAGAGGKKSKKVKTKK